MTTGGGRGFVDTEAGSITATPSWVGNQSVPSRASMPAGQAPPLHSTLSMPSPLPYAIDETSRRLPAANSSSSCLRTREMPRLLLIQRFPRPSSRIWKTPSLNRPVRVV